MQKINAIPYMFCSAYTDCYILYRVRQYLIAFLGIFIFVGCVAVGAVFADLCNKKETARKNPTVSRRFYCTGDIIRIIPISCKKAAVSQSDSPTQRPFRFWLRPTTSVQPSCGRRTRRPCLRLRRNHGAGGRLGTQGRRWTDVVGQIGRASCRERV